MHHCMGAGDRKGAVPSSAPPPPPRPTLPRPARRTRQAVAAIAVGFLLARATIAQRGAAASASCPGAAAPHATAAPPCVTHEQPRRSPPTLYAGRERRQRERAALPLSLARADGSAQPCSDAGLSRSYPPAHSARPANSGMGWGAAGRARLSLGRERAGMAGAQLHIALFEVVHRHGQAAIERALAAARRHARRPLRGDAPVPVVRGNH